MLGKRQNVMSQINGLVCKSFYCRRVNQPLYGTIPTFNDPVKEKAFENIVEKGENAGDHFTKQSPL